MVLKNLQVFMTSKKCKRFILAFIITVAIIRARIAQFLGTYSSTLFDLDQSLFQIVFKYHMKNISQSEDEILCMTSIKALEKMIEHECPEEQDN